MSGNLNTLVHHICEKPVGDLIVHVPDVNAVYQKILALNESKYANVLLLPEYNGHAVWADELAWIAANFGGVSGIPIMLDVAGGGWQYTTDEIAAALAVANVQWLRIAELVSWYIEQNEAFPDEYIASILAFCRSNNLKLYWCEWMVDYGTSVKTFNKILELISGYEDIVTVGFKTNSGDLEPYDGFAYVKGKFTHFGGTVEAWYWNTRHRDDPDLVPVDDPVNMPSSWMVRHACQLRDLGGELVQFEPYWYFFDNYGKASQNLTFLHYYLNSAMSAMQGSTVILQTLMAEWQHGVAKTDIFWSNNPIEFAFGAQPPAPDFFSMKEKNAIFCSSMGGSSPTRKLWLKLEDVAVQVVAKAASSAVGDNVLRRESMRIEVERIIHMYDVLAPLWDIDPGPTGAVHRRRIPGMSDVAISAEQSQGEDFNLARMLIQVKCKFYPRSIVTSQV